MAGRQAKRAEAKADGKTHRMPVDYQWLTLGPPTALQIERGKEIGESPDDWSGWQIEANRRVKLGVLSKAMRAIGTASAIEAQIKAAKDDPDAMPDASESGKLGEAYDGMIEFLQAHVRAWDFGDENGDPLPYTSDAWGDLDLSLIATAFAAVSNRTSTPPKA